MNDDTSAGRPDMQVTRGRPADDEVAALVAVLLSLAEGRAAASSSSTTDGDLRPPPGWTGKPAYRPPGAWTSIQVARPLIGRGEG